MDVSAGDRGRWRGGVPAWLSPDACPVQTSRQRAYRAEGIVRLERDSMAKIIKGSGNKEDNNNNNNKLKQPQQQCESKREVDKICLQHLLSFGFPLCLARFCVSVKCFLRNCHHDPGTHTHTQTHLREGVGCRAVLHTLRRWRHWPNICPFFRWTAVQGNEISDK